MYTSKGKKFAILEREYGDCIKSRRDKIGITRHIVMHQVLYNVHVTLFIGQLHNIEHLVHHDMPCDPNLVSSAFYTIPIFPFFFIYLSLVLFFVTLDIEPLNTYHFNILLGLVNIRSKGLTKQLYFPGAKPIQVHCSTACASTSTCTNIHVHSWLGLMTSELRVNKETLQGRKCISLQQFISSCIIMCMIL